MAVDNGEAYGNRYEVIHPGGTTIVMASDWDVLFGGELFFFDEDDDVCGYWPRDCWYGVING